MPVPEPGPGQVLVKVAGAGACHSDLHIMEAPGPPPGLVTELPFTLGHENAGWVERLGAGVTGFTPGDPVIVDGSAGCVRLPLWRLATVTSWASPPPTTPHAGCGNGVAKR